MKKLTLKSVVFLTPLLALFCGTVSAATLTHGPVFGGVTATEAKIFVRTNGVATVDILYSTDANLSGSSASAPAQTQAGADFTARIPLNDLLPLTTYYVNVRVDGLAVFSPPYPSFGTFPDGSAGAMPFTVIGLSDFADQRGVTTTFPTFGNAALEDAAFVWIGGDFDHRDTGGSISSKRRVLRALYNPASIGLTSFVEDILRRMPMVHHWDDHDAGANDVDKTFASWPASRRVFAEYVPTYPLPPASSNGVWQSFRYAQADFFVLDTRSQRDRWSDPDDSSKSMLDGNSLGANGQLEWLKSGLLASTATWKVLFSGSTANPTTKMNDGWAPYQTEWNALRSFIGENNISGVVIVSGDLHQGSLDSGTASGFPEIVVPAANIRRTGICATDDSGMTGVWDVGYMTGVCNGYAVLEFDTQPDELTLTLKNQAGTTVFSHTTTP